MSIRSSTAIVALLLFTANASPAMAVYHARMGRFLQRDPLGHVDGMNTYEYVRSGPVVHADPAGTKLCFHQNTRWEDRSRYLALLSILAKEPVMYDGLGGPGCCFKATSGATLGGQLINELVNSPNKIELLREGKLWMSSPNTIEIGPKGVYLAWFTTDWASTYPTNALLRRFPSTQNEEAALLGHEMAHAFYRDAGSNNRGIPPKTVHLERIVLRDPVSGYLVLATLPDAQVPEEEHMTIGLDRARVTTPFPMAGIELTQYRPKYSENALRQQIGGLTKRLTYRGPDIDKKSLHYIQHESMITTRVVKRAGE